MECDKEKELSKIGKDQRALIPVSTNILAAVAKALRLAVLGLASFGGSWGNSYTKFIFIFFLCGHQEKLLRQSLS